MMIQLSADTNKHWFDTEKKAKTKQKQLQVTDEPPDGLAGQLVQVMM